MEENVLIQNGWWYTTTIDGKMYTLMVSVPENHKPNPDESEVVIVLDEMNNFVNDDRIYEKCNDLLTQIF